MAKDLTIIFLTCNKLPKKWAEFHKQTLLREAKGFPIITVSREPTDIGINLIQDGAISVSTIYRQILRASKLATTPYIAIVEDDTIYPRDHFVSFRPETFAYNMTRWNLFTWGNPTYHYKDRATNLTLIAPRELVIKCLEERYEKYPNGSKYEGEMGKKMVEDNLGLPHYESVKWNSTLPVLSLQHVHSIDDRENRMVKRMGFLRAFDIPHWGRAEDILKHW